MLSNITIKKEVDVTFRLLEEAIKDCRYPNINSS